MTNKQSDIPTGDIYIHIYIYMTNKQSEIPTGDIYIYDKQTE